MTRPPTLMSRLVGVCTREPHRAFFAAGVAALLLLSLWWAAALGAATATPGHAPTLVHALLMPLGVFPLFMLGFLFTAGPRWLQIDGPPKTAWWSLAYLPGLVLTLGGFLVGPPWPAAGVTLMLIAWLHATASWLKCVRRSQAEDRRHATRIALALIGGCAALAATLAWTLLGQSAEGAWLWLGARQLGLWGFILPVFLIVCHRMIPFFTASALPGRKAWRPFCLLDGWLLGCGILASVVPSDVALPWAHVQALVALSMAISLALASLRWHFLAAAGNRLLFMLHLSFAWLSVALLLQAVSLAGFVSSSAPAHALALGFCATMLIAFVTRVSLGHSGRPLVADNGYWAIYLALHFVAALRVLIALLGLAPTWLHAVSALWVLLMLAWAARVLPIYWRGRVPTEV